jgi:molybdate transport system substrate-binding protein
MTLMQTERRGVFLRKSGALRRGSLGVANAVAAVLVVVIVLLAATVGYVVYSASGPSTTTLYSTQFSTVTSTVSSTNGIVPLRVFAAASLGPALQALQSGYQSNNSVSLIYNFASSGALETQIAQGSPADVFISADASNNIKLQNKSLLADGNTYKTVLYNYIQVYVPLNNPKNITTLSDLLRPGVRIAIGAPGSVPAGKYTLAVWKSVQSKWGNSSSPDFKSSTYANFSANMMAHVVTQTTDVESAITQVLTGAADAAFGYVSDGVANAAQLHAIVIPSDVNVQAVYTASVIASSTHQAQANAFITWLLSPSGQAFLKKWGFAPISA